jgi:hypothetical protein
MKTCVLFEIRKFVASENKSTVPGLSDISLQKMNISCQYPHFAQTEDIWLKSTSEGKSGVSRITESTLAGGDG